MTYNFDPDRWYEDERAILDASYKAREISEAEYKDEVAELDRRYDEMIDRLDGTYKVPK